MQIVVSWFAIFEIADSDFFIDIFDMHSLFCLVIMFAVLLTFLKKIYKLQAKEYQAYLLCQSSHFLFSIINVPKVLGT